MYGERLDNPIIHRTAWLTAATALLPIGVGALVTTLDAGMAFADWPTSDGQNMLLYPWMQAARNEFVEHGHRLAGMLVGCCSIALVIAAWTQSRQRTHRIGSLLILLAVMGQGILGGTRVLWDERLLAMVHAVFAACVLAGMAGFVQLTSRRWSQPLSQSSEPAARSIDWTQLKVLVAIAPLVVLGQFVVGSLVRHQGRALHAHLGLAVVVTLVLMVAAFHAWQTQNRWLRTAAAFVVTILLIQVGLGAGAWATRFGLPLFDYVAVQHSPLQLIVRSAHTVSGMMLLVWTVILAARVYRLDAFQKQRGPRPTARFEESNHHLAVPSQGVS